ncbi:MAG TPA: hypothetical protein VK698_39710 [Kofleriaceae bacterium]|nr:hypothetical protein [Kofleriaceae bacterium]
MTIEIPDHVMKLAREAEAARVKALSEPYSREGWAPWLEAAEAFLRSAGNTELEMAAKKAARET